MTFGSGDVRSRRASLRATYVVLLATTVLVGLAVHFLGVGLAAPARDVLGDALWAAMIFWLVSLAAPKGRVSRRASAALVVCFAVELGQRIDHPILQALRGSTLGHLVLGSDFDSRDLVAYSAGVAAAILLDRTSARSGQLRRADPV